MDSLPTKQKLPKHIAFIMDGNRRWAEMHGLSTVDGHAAGMQALENILTQCKTLDIPVVSVYAFSSENWQRPQEEKEKLFQLLELYLSEKAQKLIEEGARFRFIGDLQPFSNKLKKIISQVEKHSEHNTQYTLQLALSYGGRNEIVRAVNKLLANQHNKNLEAKKNSNGENSSGVQSKKSSGTLPKKITEEEFSKLLDTNDVCYPDLLIRTGGEQRLSNFLLYQIAYTELYFTPVLWPDFDTKNLQNAINSYSGRERRYGMRILKKEVH